MGFNYLSTGNKNVWSTEDKIKLKKLAGTMTIEDLTKRFTGRSIIDVKNQCFKQGLKFSFKEVFIVIN